MKPIVLYDPEPVQNGYLTQIYFDSLLAYAQNEGKPISRISSLQDVGNCTVITHGDHLKPEVIRGLKERDNKIVSFDINDSSWLIQFYGKSPELLLIDRIYKLSGIQKKNVCKDYAIDSDFNFSLVDKEFLEPEYWAAYSAMAIAGRLTSLPYVPWTHYYGPSPLPYAQRSGKILSRGGTHFARFMVFLWLLMHDRADARSSFATEPYYSRDMNPQFRFCQSCHDIRLKNGRSPYDGSGSRVSECNSPAPWGDNLDFTTPNLWNNRCPRSFYWLSERFAEKWGLGARKQIEDALNGHFEPTQTFFEALGQATGYADLKWMYSIYVPPRFWESASARTVNFLPARTNDQIYFPEIREGEHYKTFREDFQGFNAEISQLEFDQMTSASAELYENWVRGTSYRVSTNLLAKIMGEIEEIANAS